MDQPRTPLSTPRPAEARCAVCPPDRVCSWSCNQGLSVPDIILGAVLEQSLGWTRDVTLSPEDAATQQALWETFNL